MTYCTLNILMNLYIFYNASVIVVCFQTLSCKSNNISHSFHHVPLSLQHHMCYHHPMMIYMKIWNKQVILYKEIHMNVLYVITKKFIFITFYIINMSYLWNYMNTYYVKWYMHTMLSLSIHTVSWHFVVFSSTRTYKYTNYCNNN